MHQIKKARNSFHQLPNKSDPIIDASCPIKEGGHFAAVVPNCPKETHNLLIPVAQIQKGGRQLPNFKRRPLCGRSFHLSKRDPYYLLLMPVVPTSKRRPNSVIRKWLTGCFGCTIYWARGPAAVISFAVPKILTLTLIIGNYI